MAHFESRIKVLNGAFRRAVEKLEGDVSPKGVHRLRTTIRRVESLLGFMSPDPGKKEQKILEGLGDLRKRAGRVRDLDVQMGLLGSIGNGSTAPDRRALAEFLKSKRERQAQRLKKATHGLEHSRLYSRLHKIAQQARLWDVNDEPIADPLQGARASLTELAATSPGRQSLKPKRLHELRISFKQVRYTAELAADSESKRQFLEELKAAQDAIGEWHDWETLLKTAQKHFRERVNCPLVVEMRALFAAHYSTANSAASRLLSKYSSTAARKPASMTTPTPSSDLARPA